MDTRIPASLFIEAASPGGNAPGGSRTFHPLRLFVLSFLLVCIAAAQSRGQGLLSLVDIDQSAHPVITAKFYAMDESGNPLAGLGTSDITITENGLQREILGVSCPAPPPPAALSTVLMTDVSISMTTRRGGETNMEIAQAAARAWVEAMPAGVSECAIASFDDQNYLNQDFTTDRSRLLAAINSLVPNGGTEYDRGLVDRPAGAIPVAERGRYKRIVIFLTDGMGLGTEERIVQAARDAGVTIYCVTIGMNAPPILRNVAERTGGLWFENIGSADEARVVYRTILAIAQGLEPCTIQWRSDRMCVPLREVAMEIPGHALQAAATVQVSQQATGMLSFEPAFISFGGVTPGTTRDTTVTIRALNQPIRISSITTDDPRFTIVAGGAPPERTLAPGESMTITVRFAPPDSGYSLGAIIVESDACAGQDGFISGGYPGMPATRTTLRITMPNGGEELPADADTVITWRGIPADEPVRLEYSIDEGITWNPITGGATGYRQQWKVPPTPSRRCLLRASQLPVVEEVITLRGHTAPILDAAFSPDGLHVATAGSDSTVRIWDAATGTEVRVIRPTSTVLRGDQSIIRSVEFTADGLFVLIGGEDGIPRMFDWQTGTQVRQFTSFLGLRVGDVIATISPDGRFIAQGHPEGWIRVATIADGLTVFTFVQVHTATIVAMQYSPDGRFLATAGGDDHTIQIIDAANGRVLHTITSPRDEYARGVSWSPDGTKILAVFDDATVYDFPSMSPGRTIRSGVRSAFFSPNGRYIVTGNTGGTLSVYEAATGIILREYVHHTEGDVAPAKFSADSRKIISVGMENVAKIWTFEATFVTQQDHSDSLWAIVQPVASGHDLDLGEVIVGEQKDSVISAWLCNTGDGTLEVTAITLDGNQAGEFGVVSGDAPFTLRAGECRAIEFRFRPAGLGERIATVAVAASGGTVRYGIRGVGVERALEPVATLIDFGGVALGARRDTVVDVTVRNAGASPLTIESTELLGPDTVQFSIVDGGGSFTLAPGEGRRMTLRFAPRQGGRTMARIHFSYQGKGSPAETMLLGEGLCPAGDASHRLVLGDSSAIEAMPGETVVMPLLLRDAAGLPELGGRYSMSVRFNQRLLFPLDTGMALTTIDGDTLYHYSGIWDGSTDTLALLSFMAALGNVEETDLTVASFTWEWGCPIAIEYDDPHVRITICRDGGNRLFSDDGALILKPVYPNPAAAMVSVEFSTLEAGRTELFLVDALGRRATTMVDTDLPAGPHTIRFDTSPLPSGVYHCVLRTPTQRISRQVVVEK